MYSARVGRTNIVIDDDLIERAMRLYGFRSKREAVDYALRRLVGRSHSRRDMLGLRGSDVWDGDLERMRSSRVAEL